MKLSDVISVWEEIHGMNCGDLGYCDLERAIEKIVGIEDDVSGQNRVFPPNLTIEVNGRTK